MKKSDTSCANIALYEYLGDQPINSQLHANVKNGKTFTRTNPKTVEKIKEQMKYRKPREIFTDLKRDDSLNCVRDFKVIRNKKYNEHKKR